ncbi:MAG: LCP family protein [Clostridium sp.]|uniref:LCP family protein n=1 Tax=Clostridium sp. TaxID=1506 RepID=UPI003071A939
MGSNKDNKTSVNRVAKTKNVNSANSTDSNKNELRRKRLKRKKRKRLILTILISAIAIVAIFSVSLFFTVGKMKRTELNDNNLGISDKFKNNEGSSKTYKNIVNIVLFGLDEKVDNIQRSDAIMIGTLDPLNNKIKITSLMRDTYVNIPGYGYDKLNHAYAFGGPELAIKTINKNFDLNITDYVSVDFTELESIIDAIGGIDMEMTQTELEHVNAYLDTVYTAAKKTPKHVSFNRDGKVHMTGYEALGYTRIRGTDNGDFDRTERQRKITNEMFNKISSAGITKLALMTNKLLPFVETSLSNTEILNLGTQVLQMGSSNLEQARFPRDEYSENALINKIFYLTYDEEIAKKEIYQYIFNDNKLWQTP